MSDELINLFVAALVVTVMAYVAGVVIFILVLAGIEAVHLLF